MNGFRLWFKIYFKEIHLDYPEKTGFVVLYSLKLLVVLFVELKFF